MPAVDGPVCDICGSTEWNDTVEYGCHILVCLGCGNRIRE